MYEAFYGLRERPFNLTPDPRFLYLSENHKEALAHLIYGIKNHSGFVMVSGEIGTGKTTICRNLLNELDSGTEIAYIFNPNLSPVELMKKINSEFGVRHDANTVLELVEELNYHLLEQAGKGKNCVLVIDEAQNLDVTVLEQIRLISNLETETTKLLQIILIGQPELLEKLALHEMRQLNQRITARYHLHPLSEKETVHYIAYRLHTAGARKTVKFTPSAIRLIYKITGGTPRMINSICDRALLLGYTREQRTISKAMIRYAANEVRGEQPRSRRWNRWKSYSWLPSPALIVAVILVLVLIGPLKKFTRELELFNAFWTSETDAPQSIPVHETAEAKPLPQNETTPSPQALPQKTELAKRVMDRLNVLESPTPATGAPSFTDRLAGLSLDEARSGAMAALLDEWKIPLHGAYPESDAPNSIAAFAQSHGFAFERLTPALDQLLAIGLPAAVRVRHGQDFLWLGLLRVEGDEVEVSLGPGQRTTAPRDIFREIYAGEAFLFWRDPDPTAPALLPGRAGPPVAELKAALRRLGRIGPSNTSVRYDAETQAAVTRIQMETGLPVDGMAGKQVRMVLSSWIPPLHTPGLRPWAQSAAPVLAEAPPPAVEAPVKPPMPSPVQVEAPAPTPVEEAPQTAEVEPETATESKASPESTALEAWRRGSGETGSQTLVEPGSDGSAFIDATGTRQAPALLSIRDLPDISEISGPSALATETPRDATPPAWSGFPLVPHEPDRP